MEGLYVIALDTHCAFAEVGVLTPGGRCPTTIPDLVAEVERVRNPREVVLEEGPPAEGIARGLMVHAQGATVCNPRRNHLIAKDSDKGDAIDAEKLARLYRGGCVKAVHHAESFDRVVFKRRVGLYHDAVKQRVRMANWISGEF
jgi:hypothetical protein